MKVALIQTQLFWENPKKNLEHFDDLLNSLNEKVDVILLPEMFSTGFTMKPEILAEQTPGLALTWLIQKAKQKKSIIAGSISVKERSNFFNRLYWVSPDGTIQQYDKRHLFRMAKEDEHYTAGTNKLITQMDEWKICPLICYDLRFPVWSRNKFNKTNTSWDYDVLIYVANWPAVRSHAWKQLLVARAIENQCYVIGVNRIGKDGNGFDHSGDSMVINPRGEIISTIPENEEVISIVNLDKKYLEDFRTQFPVGLDADDFILSELP